MSLLGIVLYGNPLQTWLMALLIGVGALAVLLLVRRVLIASLDALDRRAPNPWEELVADLLRKTRLWCLMGLAVYAGAQALELSVLAHLWLSRAGVVLLLLQLALWGNHLISFLLGRYLARLEEDPTMKTTVSALGFVGRLVFFVVLFLMGLQNMGAKIDTLLAGLGVGGIAVALAVQNVLSDLLASLSIVLDRPFLIGDYIMVGDLSGTVEHIGLKTTRIRSLTGEQIIFANADLLRSRIRNYKRMFERRVVFSLGVTYQTRYEDLAAIPGLIREIVEQQAHTRFDRAHFKAYGTFSLDFEVVYYVLEADYALYMDIQQAINLALFQRFAAAGIAFAYPTQTLLLEPGGGLRPVVGAGR